MRPDEDYLRDMLRALDSIERFARGADAVSFASDELRQAAILQRLTTIGEAVARLSPATRARAPRVPWARIVAFRNQAVHAYFAVDWDFVWGVVRRRLPALRRRIEPLLRELEADR